MAKNTQGVETENTAATSGKFTRKAAVILPVLKMQEEKPIFFQPVAPFYIGKPVEKDGKEEKPADLLKVVNLETGEEALVVAGAVLKGNLEEAFPDAGYVGKKFEATKHAKQNGKRYNTYSLYEIE